MNILKHIKSISCFTLLSFTVIFSTSSHAKDIDTVLEAQPEDAQARYKYRNPKETLEFFGIEEGMTVVEILPGGGWYTKILLPVLGEKGSLIGADYSLSMWSNFGFMTPERIEEKKTWVDSWIEKTNEWAADDDASVSAFQFEALPKDFEGTADAVLFMRALHNLSRFEEKGNYLTSALADTHAVLKDGGIVGLVQHQAREDRPDDWAIGNNGYLKKSRLISIFEKNGFEFVAESDINNNAKDQANEGDNVWRLPPVYSGSKDNPELKEKMSAIGESHRMTLLFKKVAKS